MKYIDYNRELMEYLKISKAILDKLSYISYQNEWKLKVKDNKTANKFYQDTITNLIRQARYSDRRMVLYRRIIKNILTKQDEHSDGEYDGKFFPNYTKNKVLDYGCGIGDIGMVLAQIGYDVDLLEIGNSQLEKFIKWRFDRRYLPYTFIPYGEKIKPYNYDIVINIDVVEHHENPEQCIKDCYEALKIGGYFFLEIDWKERLDYKELGHLNAFEEFIKPFMEKNFEHKKLQWYKKK